MVLNTRNFGRISTNNISVYINKHIFIIYRLDKSLKKKLTTLEIRMELLIY